MGLEIETQIFKWLQSLKIVREGKRGSEGKIQIPQSTTTRLFDGLLISTIAKKILRHRGDEETAKKLQAIKQNSTPAIRLYNWNLLSDALRKLGSPLDYTQKSKLLNLEEDALLKILRFLWSIRVEQIIANDHLTVATGEVERKNLREASNVFQFLVISICTHFKLSAQHALNLFLDNNKYLAHLLVKGVKSSFQPVLKMLQDCREQVAFVVDSLLCVDQQQSLDLFLGAIKPCLISKELAVAQTCLTLLKELVQVYIQKGTSYAIPARWMDTQGLDTIFFSLKRHPDLFSPALSLAYAFLEDKLFLRLQPTDKSLLWSGQAQRLAFYNQLLSQSNPIFIQKFIADPVFQEWNKVCVKALRKAHTPKEQYQLLNLCEKLWTCRTQAFQKSDLGLTNAFTVFLKGCALASEQVVFIEATRVLFTLTVQLGLAKNINAPMLYKTVVSVFALQDKPDRIEYMLQGLLQILKDIPSLPAAPLAEPLLQLIQKSPTSTMLMLVKVVLAEGRLHPMDKEQLGQALAKLIFSDVQLGGQAQEILVQHLMRPDNNAEMQQFCSAALAQFYSLGREIHRPLKELRVDYNRYSEEDTMRKGQPNFIKQVMRYILAGNIVAFLQRAIFSNLNCKEQVEPHLFHTYIRVEKQLKKEYVSKLLMPLLRSYYDEGTLTTKIEEYLEETRPQVINFDSLAHSDNEGQVNSPSPSSSIAPRSKKSTLKTEENKRTHGIQSIRKQLELLKRKRQQEKEKSMMQQRQKQKEVVKQQLYRSVINQKRVVQYGKTRQPDVDYHNLLEFDTAKPTERHGIPELLLLDLKGDQEKTYIEDAETVMRKYRKVWRFIFFKYSSFGLKGQAEGQHPEQKINSAQIWKFLKDNELNDMKREQAQTLVKRVNDILRRRGDPLSLSYLAFQQFILQYCYIAFGKSHPQNPPGSQVRELISQLRGLAAARGQQTEMYDCPQEMFFQETDVIRQFNQRLSENPDYPLPEGYKKVRTTDIHFDYTISEAFGGIKESRRAATEALDEIMFNSLGFRLIQPMTIREERCLARPALFQKMKEKIKDYTGGYLLPKKSAYLPKIQKQLSPFKVEFHLFTQFSLGIKLGLANVDHKVRFIAEQVAYWLDDALDAVENGRLKVGNKSKTHVQNQLVTRKMSEAVQSKMEKQEQQRRDKMRADTVKIKADKFNQEKQDRERRNREEAKLQKLKRREKEESILQKKKAEFQEAKSKLQAKRREVEQKKEAELQFKRKDKQDYKKNVEEYFKKKKQELEQKERSIKETKEYQSKLEIQKKGKQLKRKQRLQIEVFRKQEEVLQKVVDTRQSYQQAWKSQQIQAQILRYRFGLRLMFDILLKYEKSKISSTSTDEISLTTLNFYALRTRLVPLLLNKTLLSILFKALCKSESRSGLAYQQFQEMLFRIIVKGKQILNTRRQDDDQFQMVEPEMANSKSSPQGDRRNKNLTDQYTLDANGVTALTVRRMMEFLNLPGDKREAEERFRGLMERSISQPETIVLREARSLLDSTLF